jgi:lysophospholipid acyltransferase (LPLAT)-like uncharacterized protein
MSGSAARAWWPEAWDRFLVPKPFATMYVRYGAPITVSRTATEEELLDLEVRLEHVLNELTQQCDADAGQ